MWRTTSTTSKSPTSPTKTYKSTIKIQLKGNTSGLGSSSSSQIKKPTTTTTQLSSNVKYTKDGTPYVTEGGENFIYLKGPNGTTKLNMDFDKDGNPIYYTKNASGTITYLQKVGHDDGDIGDFRPTLNNKPVVSVGTQTDPDITGGKTNTLTSKKPTTPNQSSSNDGKYNATLVQLDDDGNIIQQNNAGATTVQTGTGSGNKKLTKKEKIALGVVGGVAGLGTILGLSIGLTSNGNSNDNKKDDGTPPKLVPVPSAPKYSISVVNSPEGNLFTDN